MIGQFEISCFDLDKNKDLLIDRNPIDFTTGHSKILEKKSKPFLSKKLTRPPFPPASELLRFRGNGAIKNEPSPQILKMLPFAFEPTSPCHDQVMGERG